MTKEPFSTDIVIIGGCGRVGLPLGIAFASRGSSVMLYDIDNAAVESIGAGRMPFLEEGAAAPLADAVANGLLRTSTDPSVISGAENVIVVIGTPIDEHLNPDPNEVPRALRQVSEHFRDGQLLVLRSTVFPGVTAMVESLIAGLGVDMDVAFCPERIAEGKAMTELFELPQIVSSRTTQATKRADDLFRRLTPRIVEMQPEEAELAKLFTNTWRYIKFATANQFFMIANDYGFDFDRIRAGLAEDYPRAADLPGAGFAAGPCLLKDTMQLAAFNNNNFTLGHAAMMVNEGLPLYVVSKLEERFDLADKSVGILGMAFKGESDDTRDSLSYKLKRILSFRTRSVMCHDPLVTTDTSLLPLTEVVEGADILIIAAPHAEYGELETAKPVVDVWNLLGGGSVT